MNLFPYFRDVKADNVQAHFNALINQLNTVFTQIQQGAPGIFPPTVPQLRAGLRNVDTSNVVISNLPDELNDPSGITAGFQGPFFIQGSNLYNFVQTQLGYTSAQMAAFYGTLTSYPEG